MIKGEKDRLETMDTKMRVLVITYLPWRNDTSVGNSYSNIFSGMDDKIEFAHVYVKDGMPENNLVKKYYCISEKQLIKSVFTRKDVGKAFEIENSIGSAKVKYSKKYNLMRLLRWDIFFLGRDLAGSLGKWRNSSFDAFLDSFHPDIIFGTLGGNTAINQMMIYAKDKTNAKLILYPWDDWYHINKYAKSPIYKIKMKYERKYMRLTANCCEFMYTISEKMQEEYSKIFRKKCKVLRKGYDFTKEPEFKKTKPEDVRLIYSGNIGDKRWEVLAKLAEAINEINNSRNVKMKLYIYSLSAVDDEMSKALNVQGASEFMGSVSSTELPPIMNDSDILVHVEPIDKKRLETCRLSFSTKIVDYFYAGKCILAIGGQNASMKYLKDNDAAIVVENTDDIHAALNRITIDFDMINDYSKKAWNCGKRNHDIFTIQEMIYSDFLNVIEGREVQG